MKEPVPGRHGISFKKGIRMFLPSRAVGAPGKRRGIPWKNSDQSELKLEVTKVDKFCPSRASGSNDHFLEKIERHAAQAPALRERNHNFRHFSSL